MKNTPAVLITSSNELRDVVAVQPAVRRRLTKLQDWQVARLRLTYADLSCQPRYHDAFEFFVNDLYGPRDHSQRDNELSKVLRMLERLLSAQAVHALALALQLERLSLSLDLDMAKCLHDDDITPSVYGNAYRSVGRVADRQRQIALIVAAGQTLEELVTNPAVGAALWAAALPARVAGVSVLHDFLKRGYHAFSRMQGAQHLLMAIEQRETIIMNSLFMAADEPFKWRRTEINSAINASTEMQ